MSPTVPNPAGRRLAASLMALMLAMGLMAVPLPAQQVAAEEANASVDAELLEQLTDQDNATFWVILHAEANLATASSIGSWTQRGRHVHGQLTATAGQSQAGLRELLTRRGAEFTDFWIVNAILVTGDQALVDELAAQPEVAEIRLERTYELPEPAPEADGAKILAVEWGVERIGAPEVWAEFGVTGDEVIVGSLDTGVQYNHPALVGKYRGNNGDGTFDHNFNWHDPSNVCGNPSLVPCDNNGHGTHTTGTMVGDDDGDNQIGVAPGARWIAAKGCESNFCSEGALVSSGQWMLAPTDLAGENANPDLRPHIVNNSWGNDNGADTFYQAIVQAWVAAGMFPSFSNGNAGPACGTVGAPASYPESFGVGGFDINDNVYNFSSRGPSPDAVGGQIKPQVSAPAVNVRSSIPTDGYGFGTGTSMAAPHVSGTVALMWSAAPSLVGDLTQTRDILAETAIDTNDTTCGGTPENNNVWGEGRLDAFAAVSASPIGPTGTLAGTVTDAATGDPIGGATVTITGEVDRVRTTGSDGTYGLTLPVGDYSVTGSAFAYGSQTVEVTIVEDQTTTADFALETVGAVTVSGTVSDGSGHGWPVYATVRAVGTPASTFTNPFTGEYSLVLPGEATYTIVAEAEYPGYGPASEVLELGDSDATLNLAVVVDDCIAAPGYAFSETIGVLGDHDPDPLVAFLNGRGIASTAVTWDDDLSAYDLLIINRPGDPGQQAFLDFLGMTDAAGTGVIFLDTWSTVGNGVWLLWQHTGNPSSRSVGFSSAIPYLYYDVLAEHPVLDGFAVGDEAILDESASDKDHAWFGGYEGDGRMVIADAARSDTGVLGSGIGVQERANNRHVLLSMHASGPFTGPRFWHTDAGDILVNALDWAAGGASFACEPIEGGLVIGHVTDGNTGDAINGATVRSDGNPADRGTSFATPDDPDLDDGFYWLFSSLTGSQSFTASASRYVDATQVVNVVADAANRADFTLGAGLLSVSPTAVEATVRLGQSANRTFVITNTGSAPAAVELSERRGSFEILGGGMSAPARAAGDGEVRYVEGEFSPAAGPMGREAPAAGPSDTAPAADPWTNLPGYPVSVMDASATVVDDSLYAFGGFTPSGVTANAYRFDAAAEAWSPIASIPGPRQKAEVVAIDGLIYVFGGWDGSGGTTATTLIYDPEADAWSQGANMPAGRTAPGAAVLDGQVYLVGGCTTNACPTTNTVFRYDPGADAWDTVANYPQSTAWLGCAGLEGSVVCTGGTDGTGTSTSTFAYDPGSDAWSARASLPYDNWAMAYAPANGQLVISGGVTQGFNVVTNRSAAYDPASDSWEEIEPSNQSVYRVAGACGFYKVGGSTGGFTPQSFAERHPEFTDCVSDVDVPWLSVSPLSATLQPGDSLTVTVSMDSGAVDQPGTYTAGVGIRHDTPSTVPPVGVTMNVTAPTNWGKVAGTVTGISCQGVENPLAGATVQINGRQQQVTLSTDADGGYARWMASNNSPLTMIVAHGGYQPQTRQVTLRPRQTVIANFALQAICGSGTLGDDRLR